MISDLPIGIGRAAVELVSMRTERGAVLDGALWMPQEDPIATIVHLHGKGGNFYSGPCRWLPSLMSGAPIAHLSCNMSCHDLGYTRYDLPDSDGDEAVSVAGGMWEDLEAGVVDVTVAVGYAREVVGRPVFVAGHSSGGYYAVRYAAGDAGLAGRILLSPLMSNRTPLPIWFSEGELEDAVRRANELDAHGRGHLLLALPHWYYAISATSLLERVQDTSEVWENALTASPAPILWIWGSAERVGDAYSACFDSLEIEDRVRVVLPSAEHNYIGHEASVARAVSEFILARTS